MYISFLFFILQSQLFESQNILRFADYLYAQEDYVAALGEYRRYLFLTDSIDEEGYEKIINCLVKLKRFDEAIKESERFKNDTKNNFMKGWIYFLAGKYDSSRTYLNHVGVPYKADIERIIGLGYAYEFKFSEAGKYIKMPDKKPRQKKALLGAMCALFPGGGHIYSGRIGDGIFSLLVVGTSALIAYYYYNRAEEIKFGISLGATIVFYAANIYGGINAVRNYNYYQNQVYLREIEQINE